jgi:hypothetical protein
MCIQLPLIFEWDERKNRTNTVKLGISFETAKFVFDDQYLVSFPERNAQYEKAMIVAKLRSARQRMKAKTGKCEGRKLYGEKPGEAVIRDRIGTMDKAGSTLQAICDTLNAEGVKTRYGKIWMPMTVQRIAGRKH